MSDVVITAAEEYARRCDCSEEKAMAIVTGQRGPIPGTERILDECVSYAFEYHTK